MSTLKKFNRATKSLRSILFRENNIEILFLGPIANSLKTKYTCQLKGILKDAQSYLTKKKAQEKIPKQGI